MKFIKISVLGHVQLIVRSWFSMRIVIFYENPALKVIISGSP